MMKIPSNFLAYGRQVTGAVRANMRARYDYSAHQASIENANKMLPTMATASAEIRNHGMSVLLVVISIRKSLNRYGERQRLCFGYAA